MLVLMENSEYLIEGQRMKFLETIDNGEVSVFGTEEGIVKYETGMLFELDIEEIKE